MTKHVAVAGAGLGGLRVAEQLRAAGHAGPITVIGAEPHLPYNRPPLSKELLAHELLGGPADDDAGGGGGAGQTGAGGTEAAGVDELGALLQRVAFRRRAAVADVTFRLGVAVTGADLPAGTLALADGATVRADGVVAATGLRPRRLNVPGPAGPGSGRHVLRTLDDAAGLRAELRAALQAALPAARENSARTEPSSPAAGRTPSPAAGAAATSDAGPPLPRVVVVGGGFVGCEVACTARALGCDVTVVEPAGPPMLRVLGEQVAKSVQGSHERSGISFVLGQAVIAYAGQHRVTGVVLAGGAGAASARVPSAAGSGAPGSGGTGSGGTGLGKLAVADAVLPADLVIEAIGSVPNSEWLDGNGLDLSDGVLCDNTLAAVAAFADPVGSRGVPVTAVGDVARFPNPLYDDVPRRVEHWSMPTDTARRAAATLHAKLAGDRVADDPFRPLPSFWSDQGELRMWSFGSPGLADDVEITEGDLSDPARGLLATYRRGGHLVGSVAVNLPPLRHRELRTALLAQ